MNNQNCLSCIHAFSDDNDELICTVEEEHEKVMKVTLVKSGAFAQLSTRK